jgi:uncharacterized protein YkwD
MRVLKKVVRSVAVFLGVVLIIGGIFAASHEVHARSNGKTGILSQVFANPGEAFYEIKTGIAKISPEIAKIFGQPQTAEVTPQKISTENQLTPAAKPAQTKPPSQSVPQQPRRTNPTNQSRPQRQPAPVVPPSPRLTQEPASVEQVDPVSPPESPASIRRINMTLDELQRIYPEGQPFIWTNQELINDLVRQVNAERVALGRNPLKLHPRLVESARLKVKDQLLYRTEGHDSPRIGTMRELITRTMFPNPYVNIETAIRYSSFNCGENLSGILGSISFGTNKFYTEQFKNAEINRFMSLKRKDAVPGFMRSPGHRAAMVGENANWEGYTWQHIGISVGHIFWYDPVMKPEEEHRAFILSTGERYILRSEVRLAMHFSGSFSPYAIPAEEFLRLNPDILLRVQQQGQ